jgi:hypothetical protein
MASDISDINLTFGRPLPKTYYPGVHDWHEATQLVVSEGRSLENVVFQLPDFGKPRHLEVVVVSEDNVPVRGAVVQDGGLDPGDERATNFGGQRVSDALGRVGLEVWPICNYRIEATFYPPGGGVTTWTTASIGVPAGNDPARLVMKLPSHRIGNPH